MTGSAGRTLDLQGLPWLQAADLSEDGRRVAYVLRVAADDVEHAELWIAADDGDPGRRVLSAPALGEPRWSPDGTEIALVGVLDDLPQLLLVDVSSGTVSALTSLPCDVAGRPAWSPDGGALAFSASARRERRDTSAPYRITRRVWRSDAVGLVDDAVCELWTVPRGGGDPVCLTSDEGIATDPQWSPSGDAILYRVACPPDATDVRDAVLRIVRNGRSRTIVAVGYRPARGVWLPDGGGIAFVGWVPGRPRGYGEHLFTVALDDGAHPVCRSTGTSGTVNGLLQTDMPTPLPWQATEILTDARAGTLLVRVQSGGTLNVTAFTAVGPTGERAVLDGPRTCLPLALRDSGTRLLSAVSDENEALSLRLLDRESGVEWRVGPAAGPLPEIVVEPIEVTTRGPLPVHGWLARRPDQALPAPTILYAHGGPHIAMGHVLHLDVRNLIEAGYAVVMVNHRGSTGYGDQFARALSGDWGEGDGGDLLAVLDEAVACGFADPARLGVCGASGGGFLTCWLICATDRFRAAVAENPVTNFVSYFGTSDVGPIFVPDELGGRHPHDAVRWLDHSPALRASECHTPTLLIQSDDDCRCPPEQAEQFYAVLRASGCHAEMLRLPASRHGASTTGPVRVRRAQDAALVEWLVRHV